MERVLGLPPLNQMDAMAPVMTACFQGKPDLRPFTALPNKVPLAQLNPPKTALSPAARRLAELSERLDFRHVDAADEDDLNRILWHAAKGMSARYPAHLVASHAEDRRRLRQDPD
jgi:hypothetical protein